MNKKEKEKYKKKLLERKKEIADVLSEVYNETKEVENTGIAMDMADKAESSYTKEFLLNLSDTERKQLQLIDEALDRIEKSNYGICQTCDVKIGKKRLDAVPWAPNCIDCQQKAEEESY
ncbi:MAG: TraR/DksA family transcriptional regulator [Candidatus Aminicenantes bacterium]|nr:MAG: TraR/DksA family transcriptional regulator [Candidatus Aminicenantes bacterium]